LQVACFDTAFHRSHGPLADHYAIPERSYQEGVRRYGFHGLSYEYIAGRLPQLNLRSPKAASLSPISAAALQCAPSPTAEALKARWASPRSTACRWARDPGKSIRASSFIWSRRKAWLPREVEDLLYQQSGLKGLSGIS